MECFLFMDSSGMIPPVTLDNFDGRSQELFFRRLVFRHILILEIRVV